jgi:citrate synthase
MERLGRIASHVTAGAQQTLLSPLPTLADSPIIAKLKSQMAPLIKEKLALKTKLLKEQGDTKIQDLTVEMCINGARSAKAMVTETSDLDANTGIAYRHLSLYEVNEKLPKAKGGEVALPEAAFWLLLTGQEPTDADVKAMTEELHKRASVPQYAMAIMDALPKDMHPMTQLAMGMLALQKESKFQAAYDSGMKKDAYWEYALEDSLDLAARIPVIAAKIYHRTFKNGSGPAYDSSLDWAGNYAQMLGTSSDPNFKEATRLYLMLHADHEGGNVSAHTSHLVGSALSDPYYSVAAGLCGLAGPLHGLANQECLGWLLQVQKDLGDTEPTKESLTDYAKKTLAAGKVIPGFGHAVLRQTDPRYMLEREFALKHMQGDPLFKLVDACYQALPPLLGSLGKVKNPNPNVDAHSGQIMSFYGLTEQNYYTVVFAVSRSLGIVSQIVWARAIGLPIERPKSVPLDTLMKLAQKK